MLAKLQMYLFDKGDKDSFFWIRLGNLVQDVRTKIGA